MKKQTSKPEDKLSPENKKYILNVLDSFISFLNRQKLKEDFNRHPKVLFENFDADNTMKVDGMDIIHFNLAQLKDCSIAYYLMVILHETYHALINNIPNKIDATRVKDYYYNQMMMHIDVEADYYVAKFLREEMYVKFDDYLGTYYSGANIFRDVEIRPLKFERFMCSMLTVAHLYQHHELAIHRITQEAVRMSKKPKAILHKTGISEIKSIKLNGKNIDDLIKLYQYPDSFTENEYVEKIRNILCRAVDGHNEKLHAQAKFKIKKP